MKRAFVVSMFLGLGAGAVGLGAPNNLALKGSDALFNLTQAVLAECPNATGLTYVGTGSANGESALLAETQTVAPMSRFLGASVCNALPRSRPQTSEGIAIAADGISVVTSQTHQAACDPLNTSANCNHTGGAATGLARNTVLTDPSLPGGSYTLTDWREPLRLIYFGVRHFTGTLSVEDTIASRNCSDPVRFYLAENYGKLFQNECGGDTGGCVKLKHAFRQDQSSGTTDSFRVLLGFQDLQGVLGAPFCNQWIPNATSSGPNTVGGDHYYNSYDKSQSPPFTRPAARGQQPLLFGVNKGCTSTAGCGSPGLVCTGAAPDATHIGTCQPKPCTTATDCGTGTGISELSCNSLGVCQPVVVPGSGVLPAAWRENYQDSDPVRRTCDGLNDSTGAAEQVCSYRGDLGLVLPISVPSVTPAIAYPSTPCDPAVPFRNGVGIRIAGPDANGDSVCALCPNGAMPNGTAWNAAIQAAVGPSTCQCLVPVSAGNDARCLNSKGNFPTQSAYSFPTLDGVGVDQAMRSSGTNPKFPAGIRDGRVYNLHLRNNAAGGYVQQVVAYGSTSFSVPVVGAFYRIHSTRTLLASGTCPDVGGACCQRRDSTTQIGCLVQASACSIGVAARGAAEAVNLLASEGTQAAFGAALNQVTPDATCILAGSYPLSRILYLNTILGFETMPTSGDQELELTRCFSGMGTGLSSMNTVAGQNAVVAGYGYIPINPFCKDFQEELTSVCPPDPDSPDPIGVNACANNAGLGIAP